ncbi:hypothetical protein EDB83DRAFT_2522633 [Lactarius deliciosus]|nr:hypothetical protein EDB83DRAFT_2522633 [Lactarius deliciosus]
MRATRLHNATPLSPAGHADSGTICNDDRSSTAAHSANTPQVKAPADEPAGGDALSPFTPLCNPARAMLIAAPPTAPSQARACHASKPVPSDPPSPPPASPSPPVTFPYTSHHGQLPHWSSFRANFVTAWASHACASNDPKTSRALSVEASEGHNTPVDPLAPCSPHPDASLMVVEDHCFRGGVNSLSHLLRQRVQHNKRFRLSSPDTSAAPLSNLTPLHTIFPCYTLELSRDPDELATRNEPLQGPRRFRPYDPAAIRCSTRTSCAGEQLCGCSNPAHEKRHCHRNKRCKLCNSPGHAPFECLLPHSNCQATQQCRVGAKHAHVNDNDECPWTKTVNSEATPRITVSPSPPTTLISTKLPTLSLTPTGLITTIHAATLRPSISSLDDQLPLPSDPPLEHQHWQAHSVIIMHPLPDSPYDNSTLARTERRSAWRRGVLGDTLVETNHEHLLPSEDRSSLPHALIQSQVTQSAVLPVLPPPLHTLPSDTAVSSRSNPREDGLDRDSDSYETHGPALTDLHIDLSPHPTQRDTPQVSHIADPIASQRSTSTHLHQSRPQFPGPLIVPTHGKSPPAPTLVPRTPHPGRLVRSNVHPNINDREQFNINPTSGASRTTTTLQLLLVSTSPSALAQSCPPDAMLTTLDDPTVNPAFTCTRKTDTDAASFKNASLTSESQTPAHAPSRSRRTSVDIVSNISRLSYNVPAHLDVTPCLFDIVNSRMFRHPTSPIHTWSTQAQTPPTSACTPTPAPPRTSSSRHIPSLGNVELAP